MFCTIPGHNSQNTLTVQDSTKMSTCVTHTIPSRQSILRSWALTILGRCQDDQTYSPHHPPCSEYPEIPRYSDHPRTVLGWAHVHFTFFTAEQYAVSLLVQLHIVWEQTIAITPLLIINISHWWMHCKYCTRVTSHHWQNQLCCFTHQSILSGFVDYMTSHLHWISNTFICRSVWAPAASSLSTIGRWPLKDAHMRAVQPV